MLGGALPLIAAYRRGALETSTRAYRAHAVVLGAGIGYILGYATTNGYFHTLGTMARVLVRPLYRLDTRKPLNLPDSADFEAISGPFYEMAGQDLKEEADRIITLASISASIGPALALSGCVLLVPGQGAQRSVSAGISALAVSLFLMAFPWLRSAQWVVLVHSWSKRRSEDALGEAFAQELQELASHLTTALEQKR